jgi:hypothetical protein
MPAPSMDYLAHHPHQAAAAPARSTAAKGARHRMTLIPVLLTTGLLLLLAVGLKFVVNPEAPLALMPGWMAALLAVGGAALLAVAGLNMAQVRR